MEEIFKKLDEAIDVALSEQKVILSDKTLTPIQAARKIQTVETVLLDIRELASDLIREKGIKLNRKYTHFGN